MEFLRSIPGTQFLLIYPVFCLFTVIIGRFFIKNDGSKSFRMPEINELDSTSIAYLRNGVVGVIEVALFNLRKQDLIGFNKNLIRADLGNPSGLSPIERVVYENLDDQGIPRNMLTRSIKNQINQYLLDTRQRLEELGLLKTSGRKWLEIMVMITVTTINALLGAAKLNLGMANGKPVLYLSLELAALVIVTFIVLRYRSRLTSLGQEYLKKLTDGYRWVLNSTDKFFESSGVSPILLAAVFGAMLFSSRFAHGEEVFGGTTASVLLRNTSSNSQSDGGCSSNSGCSMSSSGGGGCSSSSGGGCSSSSGCSGGGGGCGGCGN